MKRLLSYFRKHYTERKRSYYALMLASAGVPLMLSFILRSCIGAASMASAVELFVLVYVLWLSTVGMRSRRTMFMDNTMPLTTAERYLFIMLNSTVVALALVAVTYLPALALAKWMFPPEPMFDFVFEELFTGQVFMGLLASHAVLLVINLTARRRVYLGFIIAAAALFLAGWLISNYVPQDMHQSVRQWGNILLIVVGWGAAYPLLRYREIKM